MRSASTWSALRTGPTGPMHRRGCTLWTLGGEVVHREVPSQHLRPRRAAGRPGHGERQEDMNLVDWS